MTQAPHNPKANRLFHLIVAALQNLSSPLSPDQDLDRNLVRSSAIVSVGYKRSSRTLQVEYFSGWVCEASGVPKEIYQKLMTAKSFDAAFRSHVQNQYPMNRVGQLLPVFGG